MLQTAHVIALTSPGPGEGRAELVAALGVAFAGRGMRTLLIDFDLTGRGLSHQPPSVITGGGTDVATTTARPWGLSDVLIGEPVEACLTETGIPGLELLPLGELAEGRMAGLMSSALRRALAAAAERFDMVLIDTGPPRQGLQSAKICTEA